MTRPPKSPPVQAPAPRVLPRWVRQRAGQEDAESAIFSAGGALAALDPLVRSDDPVGALWRKRLALGAAAAVAALDGRREGEAQLRDAVALTRPGEDPGPGGRMLMGWYALGEPRSLRAADWPARLPGYFDLPAAPLTPVLRDLGAALVGRALPLRFAAEAAVTVLALGPAHRGLALWQADALLARALGWDRPVPLLAPHLPRAAFRLEGSAWLAACAGAWGRGAASAFDLHADLSRRAVALRAAAPALRGKDAAAAVRALQTEDALAAQAGERSSDRAARRLFDRLTALGLVRELTGRPTFRLYGL
ncbi:DUF1403 family protein [Paracoccus sp. 22332]|uniref:DUF1403 family protein n=1 Tax=Paracoccus sp. 22332 TaxID=3453913 RepID=UPI003F82B9B6